MAYMYTAMTNHKGELFVREYATAREYYTSTSIAEHVFEPIEPRRAYEVTLIGYEKTSNQYLVKTVSGDYEIMDAYLFDFSFNENGVLKPPPK